MIEPIQIGRALRRGWRLLLALAVVGAVIAVLLPTSAAAKQPKAYRWESQAVVGSTPSGGAFGNFVTTSQIQFLAQSFYVKAAAISKAKAVDVGNIFVTASHMTAEPQSAKASGKTATTSAPTVSKKNATGLLVLSAQADTRDLSAALVNEYAAEVGVELNALVRQRAEALAKAGSTPPPAESGYVILSPADPVLAVHSVPTTSNVLNSHKVRLVLGLGAGLLLALLILVAREYLDATVKTEARAEAHVRYPVVATIPAGPPVSADAAMGLVDVVGRPSSATAEAYRRLRTSVLFEQLSTGLVDRDRVGTFAEAFAPTTGEYRQPTPEERAVVLVVSPSAETTRATVVANLAATVAESGDRVIVVGTADLESGRVGRSGPDEEVTDAAVAAALQPSSLDGVSTLSLRPFVRNSAQLVARAGAVFDAARRLADVVIVETPPMMSLHHAEALVHAVDVVLVVVEQRVTVCAHADETGDVLRRLGAPVLGVVYTGAPAGRRSGRSDATADAAPAAEDTAADTLDLAAVERPTEVSPARS